MTAAIISVIVALALLIGGFFGIRALYLKSRQPVSLGFLAIYLFTTLLVAAYFVVTDPHVSPVRLSQAEIGWFRFAIGLGIALSCLIVLDHLLLEGYLVQKRGLYLPGPLRIAIQVALLAIVGLILLRTALKINVIALVAVPTVLTAVIGFALKDTIARLFEGIMLGRIMHIGDWVNLVGREGQVTNISLGHVTLQTREGDWLMVPNNLVAQKEIVNYSRPTRQHLCSVTIEAAFGDSPTRVIEVLERAAASAPGVVAPPDPQALVAAYQDSGIQYRVRFWIDNYAERIQIESRVLAYIWQAFRREGIEIPYPVRVTQPPAQGGQVAEQLRAAVRERLARIDFLAGLSPAEFDRLAAGVERRVYLPGEAVVREGEPGEELFYIDRGDATISARTAAGSRQTVVKLSAGQYFGEMSLLTGEPRAATATAETEMHVFVIGKRIMQELIAANPMLAEHMGDTLAERQVALTRARQTVPGPARTATAKQQGSLGDRIRRFLGRV